MTANSPQGCNPEHTGQSGRVSGQSARAHRRKRSWGKWLTTGRRLTWLWVGWWAAAIVVAVNWVREVSDVPRSALSTGAGWVCGVLAAAFFIMAWVRTFRAWGAGV